MDELSVILAVVFIVYTIGEILVLIIGTSSKSPEEITSQKDYDPFWGDTDKPFHRPECECQMCNFWRIENDRPLPPDREHKGTK